jgi:hypothetical protein
MDDLRVFANNNKNSLADYWIANLSPFYRPNNQSSNISRVDSNCDSNKLADNENNFSNSASAAREVFSIVPADKDDNNCIANKNIAIDSIDKGNNNNINANSDDTISNSNINTNSCCNYSINNNNSNSHGEIIKLDQDSNVEDKSAASITKIPNYPILLQTEACDLTFARIIQNIIGVANQPKKSDIKTRIVSELNFSMYKNRLVNLLPMYGIALPDSLFNGVPLNEVPFNKEVNRIKFLNSFADAFIELIYKNN